MWSYQSSRVWQQFHARETRYANLIALQMVSEVGKALVDCLRKRIKISSLAKHRVKGNHFIPLLFQFQSFHNHHITVSHLPPSSPSPSPLQVKQCAPPHSISCLSCLGTTNKCGNHGKQTSENPITWMYRVGGGDDGWGVGLSSERSVLVWVVATKIACKTSEQ